MAVKSFKVTEAEKSELSEEIRLLIWKYPELKTSRDVIIWWMRGKQKLKQLDKKIIEDLIERVQEDFMCCFLHYLPDAKIKFQCGKPVSARGKRRLIYSDPEETYQFCSDCYNGADFIYDRDKKRWVRTA